MTPGTLVIVTALMWTAMLVILFRILSSMEQTERRVVTLDPPRRADRRQRRG